MKLTSCFVYMSPNLRTHNKWTEVISSSYTGEVHPKHPFQNIVDITVLWVIFLTKAGLVLHFCQPLAPSLTRRYLTVQEELLKEPRFVITQTALPKLFHVEP